MWIKNERKDGEFQLFNTDNMKVISVDKIVTNNEPLFYVIMTFLNEDRIVHRYRTLNQANALVSYIFDCIASGLETIVLTMEMKDAA